MNQQGGKSKMFIRPEFKRNDVDKGVEAQLQGLFNDFGVIFGPRQETVDIEFEEIETKINGSKQENQQLRNH